MKTDVTMDFDLEKYKVRKLPASAFYVAEFLSAEEERALLASVEGAPRPKWTQLSGRRVQNWGGVPHARGMVAERLPGWLSAALARMPPGAPPRPNHVLVNEYRAGQGILPHEDGPLFHPVVATLTLGSHAVLRLTPRESAVPTGALLLEPRSLLVLRDQLYTDHLHHIEEVYCDVIDDSISNLSLCSGEYVMGTTLTRDTRISLTVRHVPKTTSFKLNIGNK